METIKNKLPQYVNDYFTRLKLYLNGDELLYYGSVQRDDYFHGQSDIDVAIFCDNEQSTINKLLNYIKRPKKKVKKIVWQLSSTNKFVYGYKVSYTYEDVRYPDNTFRIEFAIYNNKFKSGIVGLYRRKFNLPWYISFYLLVLKFIFYRLQIISLESYKSLKNYGLTKCIGMPEELFIVLENNPSFYK
jgi:hypothetical protein